MNRPRASTSATRRYRANRENRDRENRARIMGRIGEGARPRQSTLQKYNILPAEVDAARAAVSLPPLYEDNNYQSTTTLQNINEATRREIDEVKSQRPAGPVPVYYEIYAIDPAQFEGFITVQ